MMVRDLALWGNNPRAPRDTQGKSGVPFSFSAALGLESGLPLQERHQGHGRMSVPPFLQESRRRPEPSAPHCHKGKKPRCRHSERLIRKANTQFYFHKLLEYAAQHCFPLLINSQMR